MIRTRTPGGVVTPAQWLKLDAVATTYAERGLRITTRQAFQFHGVIKTRLKATMQAINAAMIDTIAACGDVSRNVVVAANPHLSQPRRGPRAGGGGVGAHAAQDTRLLRGLARRGARRRQRRGRRNELWTRLPAAHVQGRL